NFALHAPKNGAKGRIENHLSRGQEILVQVVRDAYATKPPTLSTYFSLPGRYLVLTPNTESAGISRKLDEKDRDKLRKTLEGLPLPEGCGIIARTAGASATKVEIQRDLKYLLRLWETIETAGAKVRAPKLVYQERSLVIRAIRDLYTPDIDEIAVDDEETYREIQDFFDAILPTKKKCVKLYQGDRPIFNKYNLEEQIENIFRRRVPLPSGGAIIFDTTEALTAVDVNSGKMKGESHIEDMATKANVEAAQEIARQLRLRDLGGLVVIDFIDMRASKHVRQVEKAFKDSLKKDKARYDVTRISMLGLLELSRERINPEKSSLRYTDCPTCDGTGSIKTIEAAALQALRRLQTRVVRGDLENVELQLPPDVAEYLLNQKREDLTGLEERYKTRILVKGDPAMTRDGCEVRTVARERSRETGPVVGAPTHGQILAAIEAEPDLPEPPAPPAPKAGRRKGAAKAAPAAPVAAGPGSEEAEGEGEDGGRKKRRRRRGGRRRRKGKGGEGEDAATRSEAAENGEPGGAWDEDAEGDEDFAAEDAGEASADAAEENGGRAEGAEGAEGEGDGTGKKKRRRRRGGRRRRKGKGGAEGAEPGDAQGGDEGADADDEYAEIAEKEEPEERPVVKKERPARRERKPAAAAGAPSSSLPAPPPPAPAAPVVNEADLVSGPAPRADWWRKLLGMDGTAEPGAEDRETSDDPRDEGI
ncbi:MAG: Rne/Rng family ribonuclease, partial [Acidobacteria bacterium]|nr:Rne/Rng family ribonuclease [Acidobacteriota bacterium]